MASPTILFSSAAFFARPLSWTFRLAAECGYDGVEVMVTKDPDSQDPARIRALAQEHGLGVGALHAPCLLLTRKVWGTDPIGKVDRSVEVIHRPDRRPPEDLAAAPVDELQAVPLGTAKCLHRNGVAPLGRVNTGADDNDRRGVEQGAQVPAHSCTRSARAGQDDAASCALLRSSAGTVP